MRNQPVGVGRIAVQPAAEMVIDPALDDTLQSPLGGLAVAGSARCPRDAQEQLERQALREFVGPARDSAARVIE